MHIVCPSCGFRNIAGDDRCEDCLHSLMTLDLPAPKHDDPFQEMIMTSPASDIPMTQDILVANKTDSIAKVVAAMAEHEESCVLIYENRKIIGIISERRLLTHVALRYDDLEEVTVEEIMTRNPECVQADAPLAYALNKMSICKFRHVPVLDKDGKPISLLKIRDVLNYLTKRHGPRAG